jgi:hypothetical protein
MPLGEIKIDSVFPKFGYNVETRCRIAQIQFQPEPNEAHRRELNNVLAVLEEYGEMF